MSNEHPLHIAAEAAVPLKIAEYAQRGGPTDADRERVRSYTDDLCSRSDVLIMRGGKKGESAELFSKLVDSLAVLAFCPGGVRFGGARFVGNQEKS